MILKSKGGKVILTTYNNKDKISVGDFLAAELIGSLEDSSDDIVLLRSTNPNNIIDTNKTTEKERRVSLWDFMLMAQRVF